MFSTVSSFNSFTFINAVISLPHNIWTPLGNTTYNGTNGIVNMMTYDASNSVFYVGGNFTKVYDSSNISQTVGNIAQWNIKTKTWSIIGGNSTNNGINGSPGAIVLDSSNASIYISGTFTFANSSINIISSNFFIASRSTNYLNSSNSIYTNGKVNATCIDTSNQILYAAGDFSKVYDPSNVDGLTCVSIAKFYITGNYWSLLGNTSSNGVYGTVNCLSIDISNNKLYVGGYIYLATSGFGEINIGNVVIWNTTGNSWSHLGNSSYNGSNSGVLSMVLDYPHNILYVGIAEYAANQSQTVYDPTNTSGLSFNHIVKWNTVSGNWSLLGTQSGNGTNDSVYTLALDGSYNLYAAGWFNMVYDSSNSDGLSANCIAKWSYTGNYWSRLGKSSANGVDWGIKSLAMDTTNNYLYVGGHFQNIYDSSNSSGISAKYIARWDLRTTNNYWSTLGSLSSNGTTGYVYSVTLDASYNVYVGGSFGQVYDSSNSSGLTTNNIAKWNYSGSYWSMIGASLSTGTNGSVYTSSCTSSAVYIGGLFSKSNVPISSSSYNSQVSANNIVKWNLKTNSWEYFGNSAANGANSAVSNLLLDPINKLLYVGGVFTTVYDTSNPTGLSGNHIAKWNFLTNTWNLLGNTSSNGCVLQDSGWGLNSLVLDYSNNALYVAAGFSSLYDASGGQGVDYLIVKWNTTSDRWSTLDNKKNTGKLSGNNNSVLSFALDTSNGLYVGGSFSNILVPNVGIINVTTNLAKTNSVYTNGTIHSSIADSSGQWLYVGGSFNYVYDASNINGIYANNIAKLSITGNYWAVLGNATSNGVSSGEFGTYVYSMAFDSSRNSLYVGGFFNNRNDAINGSNQAGNVAIWYATGNQWAPLGNSQSNGTNTKVMAMALDKTNNLVYMGLNRTPLWSPQTPQVWDPINSSGMYVNNIAAWNITGNCWSMLGISSANGAEDTVSALALDGSSNLYACGYFQKVYDSSNSSGITANRIAKWDSSKNVWSALGNTTSNGVSNIINSLAMDISSNRLYVGGEFNQTSDSINSSLNVNNVAIWNTTGNYWSSLGTSSFNGVLGVGNVCFLTLDTSRNLFVGGNFDTAFDSSNSSGLYVNNIAKWNFTGNYWSTVGPLNGLNSKVIAITNINSTLYYSGESYMYGVGNIIKWNITSNFWSFLGNNKCNGVDSNVSYNSLIMDSRSNRLYVGGPFQNAYDTTTNSGGIYVGRVTYFDVNKQKWNPLGGGSSGTGISGSGNYANSLGLDTSFNALYVGGTFNTAYNSSAISANNIVAWNV